MANRTRRKSYSASPARRSPLGRGRSGSSDRGQVGRGADKRARSSSSSRSTSSERRPARRGQKKVEKSKAKKQTEVILSRTVPEMLHRYQLVYRRVDSLVDFQVTAESQVGAIKTLVRFVVSIMVNIWL